MISALLLALFLVGSSVSAQTDFLITNVVDPDIFSGDVRILIDHSDVTDVENLGTAPYGAVEVKILRPGCVDPFDIYELAALAAPASGFTPFGTTADDPTLANDLARTTILVPVDNLNNAGAALGIKESVTVDSTTYTALFFCARLSLLATGGGVRSFRNVDLTLLFTTNPEASTITTAETAGGTIEDGIDLGAFSVSSVAAPSPLPQGQQLTFTLTAVSPAPTNGVVAIIQKIVQWECSDVSGKLQIIVNNGNPETSATELPPCAGTPVGEICTITTFLNTTFFTGPTDSTVTCEGTVELLLTSTRRRVRTLLSGNVFEKRTSTALTALSVNDDDDDDWSFFGWLFSCFGLF